VEWGTQVLHWLTLIDVTSLNTFERKNTLVQKKGFAVKQGKHRRNPIYGVDRDKMKK